MAQHAFPAIGRTFRAQFGGLAFRLDFDPDGEHLTFSAVGAASAEPDQTVAYTAVALREKLFLVYWQESGGTTVTHIEDFERQTLHSNITNPDGTFLTLSGTLTPVG